MSFAWFCSSVDEVQSAVHPFGKARAIQQIGGGRGFLMSEAACVLTQGSINRYFS